MMHGVYNVKRLKYLAFVNIVHVTVLTYDRPTAVLIFRLQYLGTTGLLF